MALVHDGDKPFIYIHIFKTGGNSIRDLFQGPPWEGRMEEVGGVHSCLSDVKGYFYEGGEQDFYHQAYKWAVVRNPWDWTVSTYLYIRRARRHIFHREANEKSFDEWVDWWCNHVRVCLNPRRPFLSNKYLTLEEFIIGETGRVECDKVVRFERLEEDMREVWEQIGEGEMPKLPRKNVGKRNPDYRTYYSDDSQSKVRRLFWKDITLFEYSF